jgi:hypothetical protein
VIEVRIIIASEMYGSLSSDPIDCLTERNNTPHQDFQDKQFEVIFFTEPLDSNLLQQILTSKNPVYFSAASMIQLIPLLKKTEFSLNDHHFVFFPLDSHPSFQKMKETILEKGVGSKGVLRVRRSLSSESLQYFTETVVSDLFPLSKLYGEIEQVYVKEKNDKDSGFRHLIASVLFRKQVMGHYECTFSPFLEENLYFEWSFQGGVIEWNEKNSNPLIYGSLVKKNLSLYKHSLIEEIINYCQPLTKQVVQQVKEIWEKINGSLPANEIVRGNR